MLRRLGSRLHQASGPLALFLVLTGGTAWAVNEWTGANIQDGTLTTADYKNNDIRSGDVLDDSLASADYKNNNIQSRDVLDNSLSSADISDNSLTGVDILNGSLQSADIPGFSIGTFHLTDNSVTSSEVLDRELNDEDIGEAKFVDFQAEIGTVGANQCKRLPVTGLPTAAADHLVLTADAPTNETHLAFTAEYTDDVAGTAYIKACNPTSADIHDSLGHFNLLMIDAQ